MATSLVVIHEPRNQCAESDMVLGVLETLRLRVPQVLINIEEQRKRPANLILVDRKMGRLVNNFPVLIVLDGTVDEDVLIKPTRKSFVLDFLYRNEVVEDEVPGPAANSPQGIPGIFPGSELS